MRRTVVRLALALPLLAAPALARAQAPSAAAAFKSEYLKQLDDIEKKLVQLAEAVPQDKYGWRPAKGVRSISEVYMHIAGANMMIPGALGVKPPMALPRDAETTWTDKAQVVDALKKSLAHARTIVNAVKDEDMGQEVKLFGSTSTKLGVIFLIAYHMHEHLGQSIAYARSVGVTPPWSASGGM